jgi:hypothetical protein
MPKNYPAPCPVSSQVSLTLPLIELSALIDWGRFDDAFGTYYHDRKGRRGLRTRLMTGLLPVCFCWPRRSGAWELSTGLPLTFLMAAIRRALFKSTAPRTSGRDPSYKNPTSVASLNLSMHFVIPQNHVCESMLLRFRAIVAVLLRRTTGRSHFELRCFGTAAERREARQQRVDLGLDGQAGVYGFWIIVGRPQSPTSIASESS